MKRFYLRHRGLHRWLLCLLVFLVLYFALHSHGALMTWLSERIIMPFERAVAALCYLTTVSVAEVCYVTAAAVGIFYIANVLRRLVRAENRGPIVYRFVLTVLCTLLSVYAGFCLLWGVNYHADGFQERSGICERESSVEELERVSAYFAEHLAAAADEVARDKDGAFAEAEADIFAYSVRVYDNLYEEFPFLRLRDHVPKALSLSRVMSMMDFTGFYFPFTGEANLNVDCPQSFLPATIAHEMAHQRGIASEQECNFLAVLASTTCAQPGYAYSGWLLGYIYLGNALSRADHDAWEGVWAELPETVKADLRNNNAYWKQFQNAAVQKVSNTVYDSFLKSYGETLGLQTYGTVTDLLVVWYADAAKAG